MTISGHSDLFYIALSYGAAGVVLGALVLQSILSWHSARRMARGE